MNARYDDVIVALMQDQLDRAIELIEQMKEQNKSLSYTKVLSRGGQLVYRDTEVFELKPTEPMEFEKTTDFLPFHGWEAA